MKVNEFKKTLDATSEVELGTKLRDERANLYKLRQKMALKQQDNPLAIRQARKNIARIMTKIRQDEMKAGKE